MINGKMRGAWPTPRHVLVAADRHIITPAPPKFLMWPIQLNPWGNYGLGDCVTAEEAFAKSCVPGIFFSQKNVIRWARAHGYAQGAYLTTVMKTMQTDGFVTDGKHYNDGRYSSVNWTDEAALASACFSSGPVKLGVAADQLENIVTAGVSGWSGTLPKNENEDHCISLCGYGTLADLTSLFLAYGVSVKSDLKQPFGMSYAVFTWDSIGIIDAQSMINITAEAWVRSPGSIVPA